VSFDEKSSYCDEQLKDDICRPPLKYGDTPVIRSHSHRKVTALSK
jgi:hypothetical protein